MFRSQTMRKVELIVPEHDVVHVTETLAASDVFHLNHSDSVGTASTSGSTSEWHEQAATFAALEQRILNVMKALSVEEGQPPTQELHLIGSDVAERDISHLEHEAEKPVHELEIAQHKLDRLRRYLRQLQPIADVDVDLGALRSMRYTFVLLGTMPVDNVERLQTSLEHVPFVLFTLRSDDHLATVVLFGLQRDVEILTRATRSAYLNPLPLPDNYRGTPSEAIAALQAGIKRTRLHIAESQETILHLHEARVRHLRHLLWRVRASRKLVEIIASYQRLRYMYLITGWVPVDKVEQLKRKLADVSDQVIVNVDAPRKIEVAQVPVAFNNPPPMRGFEGLVTNYGYPCYNELDPTPVMALTFPLVFGIMFGDVGHGLLLALLGLLLVSKRIRPLKQLASLGGVILACGVAAIVFGFFYGSLFGFESILEPLWLRPLEDITDILIGAIGFGMGVLSLGMIYNVINSALQRQWGNALFSRNGIAGLAFYWSLVGLASTAFVPIPVLNPAMLIIVAILAGLTIAFSELLQRLIAWHKPFIEGDLGTYLMQAFFELFETVIGLLSNTLSYVRMGAFAVAHGALSLVVFILAGIIGPRQGIGYWLVVALGNLVVIGFEGMIVAIQTLRLEYYEFFSKFFSGSGECYHPLSLVSKAEGQ